MSDGNLEPGIAGQGGAQQGRAPGKRGRALRGGLAIGLAVAVVGAVGVQRHRARTAKVSVIRIGSTAPGHLKFVLNQQRKWLDEELAKDGIRVEYHPFTGGGSEATTALATGSLDLAYTGSNPALRTAAARADVKLVGISSFNPLVTSSIVVAAGSPIRSVQDLKGRKVAYLAGTVRHSTLAKSLRAAGLTVADVQSVNLAFQASGPALARGDIDALVEGEDTVQPLVEKGVARVLVSGRDHPEWASPSAISANGELVRRHPDLVRRVLEIDLQTARWADAHADETIAIFAAATRKSERSVRDNYPNGVFYQEPRITQAAIDAFKGEEAFMKEAGLLQGSVDYATWIDASFVDAAYGALAKR